MVEQEHKKFMNLILRFVKNILQKKKFLNSVLVLNTLGRRFSAKNNVSLNIDVSAVEVKKLKDGVYVIGMRVGMGKSYIYLDPYIQDEEVDQKFIDSYLDSKNRMGVFFNVDTFVKDVERYTDDINNFIPFVSVNFNTNKAGFLMYNYSKRKRAKWESTSNPFDLGSYKNLLHGLATFLLIRRKYDL